MAISYQAVITSNRDRDRQTDGVQLCNVQERRFINFIGISTVNKSRPTNLKLLQKSTFRILDVRIRHSSRKRMKQSKKPL